MQEKTAEQLQTPSDIAFETLGGPVSVEAVKAWNKFFSGNPPRHNVTDIWHMLDDEDGIDNPGVRAIAAISVTAPISYTLEKISVPNHCSLDEVFKMKEEVDGSETSNLRDRLTSKPRKVADLAYGIMFWTQDLTKKIKQDAPNADAIRSWFPLYSSVIRSLLPLMGNEGLADELFEHYIVKDPESIHQAYLATDNQRELLCNSDIPKKYKDKLLYRLYDDTDESLVSIYEKGPEYKTDFFRRGVIRELWLTRLLRDITNRSERDQNNDIITDIVTRLEVRAEKSEKYLEGYNLMSVVDHIKDDKVKFACLYRHLFAISQNPSVDKRYLLNVVSNDDESKVLDWAVEYAESGAVDLTKSELRHLKSVAKKIMAEYQKKLKKEEAEKKAEDVAWESLKNL